MISRWNKVILSRLCQISHHNLGRNSPPPPPIKENTINLCFRLFFFLKKQPPNPAAVSTWTLSQNSAPLWISLELDLNWNTWMIKTRCNEAAFYILFTILCKISKANKQPTTKKERKTLLAICSLSNAVLESNFVSISTWWFFFFFNFPPVTNLLWN